MLKLWVSLQALTATLVTGSSTTRAASRHRDEDGVATLETLFVPVIMLVAAIAVVTADLVVKHMRHRHGVGQ